MSWQIIRSYRSRDSADHAALLLHGCGIKTLISGDDAGGIRPDFAFFFGVNLLVDPARATEASAILADADNSHSNSHNSLKKDASNRRLELTKFFMRWAWIALIAVVVFYYDRAQVPHDNTDGIVSIFILGAISFGLTMEYLRQKAKAHRALIWKQEEQEQNLNR